MRLILTVLCAIPFYVLPVLIRTAMVGWAPWWAGAIGVAAFGWLAAGFLTNNYRFGLLVYLSATVLEGILVSQGCKVVAVMWAIGVFPALTTTFFVQQLLINLGD